MYKSGFTIVTLLLVIVACGTGSSNESSEALNPRITVSGTVSYPQSGVITLEKFEGNQPTHFDTLTLDENYSFTKKVRLDEPGYYRFNFYDLQFVNVLLHEDDINVRVDGNNRAGFAEISGSRDHDFINRFQQLNASFQSSPEVQEIKRKFNAARNSNDQATIEVLQGSYMELDVLFKA